jgi:hypothetical protein
MSFVLVAGCLIALAGTASAQEPPPREPAGGLFGATRNEVGARDRLTFAFQVAEGYESEVPEAFRLRVPQQSHADGWSTLFYGSSDYVRRNRTLELSGSASTAIRYYHEIDQLKALSHGAGLGVSVKLPKQGRFRVDSSAAYSPSYLYELFPVGTPPALGESIPTNPDYQIAPTASYSYRTLAALSFGSRVGTMVTVNGQFNRTDFEQPTTRLDLEFTDAGVTAAHAFGRSAAMFAGYRHRAGQFGFGEFTREHRLTVGADLSNALSRSRRATIRLSLSPSRLDLPATVLDPITGEPAGRLYRINGDVSVVYPFRVNWRLAGAFRRESEFLAIFAEPVLSDGARVELSGLISRRLDVTGVAGYAAGASALSDNSDFETYTGEVRLRYAVKRSIALYTQYYYYHYDVREQTLLAPDLPRVFDQHGARLGVMLFLEAFRR